MNEGKKKEEERKNEFEERKIMEKKMWVKTRLPVKRSQ